MIFRNVGVSRRLGTLLVTNSSQGTNNDFIFRRELTTQQTELINQIYHSDLVYYHKII